MRPSSVLRLAVAVCLAAPVFASAPATAAPETVLTFSIREARAYAYRVTLSGEVIEVAQTLQPCDPEEDPYQCDDAAYEHAPNCPPAVALGPTKEAPEPEPFPGVEPVEGGSGDDAGPDEPPPLASPITLNEQLSLGTLSHLAGVVEAGGLATDSYVDLSGRQEPAMHTESDAFSPNRGTYEERCAPADDAEEYAHFLSRSFQTPETYHLAECREGECTFGGIAFGAEAEEARTVVHLFERGGRVHGLVHASLHDAVWAGGALTMDLLDSTVTFSSDGTERGLEYSVTTAAVGVRLGGEPIALAPGQPIAIGDMQIGLAAPSVKAAEDGGGLRVVAPGLYLAVPNQTVFFGGAELHATMGRDPVTPGGIVDPGDGIDTGPIGPGVSLPTPSPSPSPSATTVAAPPEPEYAVSRVETAGWVVPATLGAGLLVALLLLFRWIGRFPWGRRLQRTRPFRSIDWLYRAFVKT